MSIMLENLPSNRDYVRLGLALYERFEVALPLEQRLRFSEIVGVPIVNFGDAALGVIQDLRDRQPLHAERAHARGDRPAKIVEAEILERGALPEAYEPQLRVRDRPSELSADEYERAVVRELP